MKCSIDCGSSDVQAHHFVRNREWRNLATKPIP
jgi:hypothetical protein